MNVCGRHATTVLLKHLYGARLLAHPGLYTLTVQHHRKLRTLPCELWDYLTSSVVAAQSKHCIWPRDCRSIWLGFNVA